MTPPLTVRANIGDLAKPVTALVEKVFEAAGVVFEPHKIVRKAKAEAEAAIIEANSKIEISEIERRALQRMIREEGIRQENMENILQRTLPYLEDSSDPSKLDNDWIASFFEKIKFISNTDLQEFGQNS